MKKFFTSRPFIIVGAATALLAGGLGGAAAGAATGSHETESDSNPISAYSTNSEGLTYGSAADAPTPQSEPDLILVVATNGQEGYVLKEDLDAASGANVGSPEEAVEWQKSQPSHTSISVFESDGKTVIGEFSIGKARE
ncbi:MAG TPA: hypothetical protein H9830_00480 [Candidatus Agrococcus pullicola]|uniref:Uncharacterized protein n=1 Tax=Candidatus Agrococcus pullicola TaxID=2838429 RepID=A0A9D1YS09_9MICO|nr:hypothetical protein [Candidatus Agrococcus pullicola]